MATATTLLSLDEYLRTSYKPDCDFVDGELVERNVGEKPHSRVQGRLIAWFIEHEADWQIETFPEQRMKVDPSRFRVCDVCVLNADAADDDQVVVAPPLLCIEVLSPEDRLPRAKIVLDDYLRMGVQDIWLIDPQRRCAYVYDADGLRLTGTERLEVAGTPIYLPLDDLFAKLDHKQKDATRTAAPSEQ